MKKSKKFVGIALSLLSIIAMSNTAFADSDLEQIEPNGMYIRQCVAYEPNYTSIDYTNTFVGSVSGDNTQGSNVMYITYVYETSGTTTASISGYANASAEANIVFAKMQAEVSSSCSWTRGTSSGTSYGVPPGRFEILNVYIPAVRTAGRLKYKVYMDGYPENVFYEYDTLNESYAPRKNSVHYQVVSVSRSPIQIPQDMTVYTSNGL